MKLKNKIIIGISIVCLLCICAFIYSFWRYVHYGIPNAYMKWHLAGYIIEYHKLHNDWPKKWDDLENIKIKDISGPFEIDRIRNVIKCDFNRLPEFENGKYSAKYKIITVYKNPDCSWQGAEPHEMIVNYLKIKKSG